MKLGTRHLRRGGAGLVIGALVVTSGTAGAATGAAPILGRSNTASAPTTLKNTGVGPALKLRSSSGSAPLAVAGNSRKVHSLNADQLDGMSSTAFRSFFRRGGLNHPDEIELNADISRYRVPKGVRVLRVTLQGGGGGGGGGHPYTPADDVATGGGQGAHLEFVMRVTPGELLAVQPGDAGKRGDSDDATAGLPSRVWRWGAFDSRVSAEGGEPGTAPASPAPGTCTSGAAGAGGSYPTAAGQFVLAASPGAKGGEACAGMGEAARTGSGGGPVGVAGSGGAGSQLGEHGVAGYVLITPLRG